MFDLIICNEDIVDDTLLKNNMYKSTTFHAYVCIIYMSWGQKLYGFGEVVHQLYLILA